MENIADQLSSLSLSFVENLYAEYLRDPASVPSDWQGYFQGLPRGNGGGRVARPALAAPVAQAPLTAGPPAAHTHLPTFKRMGRCAICGRGEELTALQHRVDQVIRNYRVRGHRIAQLDPLGRPLPNMPELDLAYNGLGEEHLELPFSTGTLSPSGVLTLREIVERLRETYCRSIGVQFMHIDSVVVREWLQERMESSANRIELSRDEQIRILTRLTDAVIFEEFIQKKFIGAKSFSLEGAESLIPLLDILVDRAGEHGMNEVVIGMAHRGRLNVLANILGKSPRLIFREFADADTDLYTGRGDVKYHLGYHNDWMTACGHPVHLALCFNPSHLEYVNPVALGRTRAKQDRLSDLTHDNYAVVLIHGDAAFAGEGIVQETLNLSELPGYTTGGTVHIIVNNQIGFTTNPNDSRSGLYATGVAKMLQIPLFHVNGENPEAVAQVVKLAMEFRKAFKRDVVIDMYCYRRRGHNEGDEPAFTQPVMYRAIQQRPSVRESYMEHLLKLNEVTREEADEIAEHRREHLEEELAGLREVDKTVRPSILGRVWQRYTGGYETTVADVDTGVAADRLRTLLRAQTQLPQDFHLHPKLQRFVEGRVHMADGDKPLDWSAAESLAFASLVTSGCRVRLTGQDSQRGTFSHRHSVLHNPENDQTYMPLQHLAPDQAPIDIFNSPLSEAGVLGFEYGYSIAYPDALVIWEAQFGDFCNVAQVIIDQFLASAEDKWKSLSGLVLLLPHGFEGMGPEHSSARLERFLSLSAEDNLQVVVPSTPAQFFHCLRRQVLRPWRKPLIVMTPKSLLRHPKCVSPLEELTQGTFQRVLPDTMVKPEAARQLLLCCGKIYYELAEERERLGRSDVAIIRIEQLYPFQMPHLEAALRPYRADLPATWVQEEPENMGAWRHLHNILGDRLNDHPFRGISRGTSASPATGSASAHKKEQQELLTRAFHEITPV